MAIQDLSNTEVEAVSGGFFFCCLPWFGSWFGGFNWGCRPATVTPTPTPTPTRVPQ